MIEAAAEAARARAWAARAWGVPAVVAFLRGRVLLGEVARPSAEEPKLTAADYRARAGSRLSALPGSRTGWRSGSGSTPSHLDLPAVVCRRQHRLARRRLSAHGPPAAPLRHAASPAVMPMPASPNAIVVTNYFCSCSDTCTPTDVVSTRARNEVRVGPATSSRTSRTTQDGGHRARPVQRFRTPVNHDGHDRPPSRTSSLTSVTGAWERNPASV
jgi:hypothetical protein